MFVNLHLLKYLRNAWGKTALVIGLNLVVTLLSSAVSLLTAILVDVLLRGGSLRFFSSLAEIYWSIAVVLTASFIFFKIRSSQAEKTGIYIKDNVRAHLMQKLFQLGPAYTSKSRTGVLASTLTSKVERLKYYYSNYLPAATSAIVNSAIFLCALFRLDSLSGCVALTACAGMLVCPMSFFHLTKNLGKEEWAEHAKYYSDCLDGIQGVSTLKALNANRLQVGRIAGQGERFRKAVMSHLKVTMTEGSVLELFARIGSSITVAVVVLRHIGGHIQPESTVFAYFYISACFAPMLGLINAWHLGFQGVSASYSIAELLDEAVTYSLLETGTGAPLMNKLELETYLEKASAAPQSAPRPVSGDIRFSKVCFGYSRLDGEVIHEFDLTIRKGTMTALVGPSGSGKSTLAHLLAGFYVVENGYISIGDTILDKDTVGFFQDQISAVWQDSHLFYGTVFENILLGKPDATDDEVYAASMKANLHDFVVSLPEGYGTVIGERGMRFSGGERQRVAIARAYLRDAPILIFDEATSALDRQNEIDIQRSFKKLREDRTSLVIAHRLSTIKDADETCVIEKGRIVALGKHRDLMRESGLYRQLMLGQFTSLDHALQEGGSLTV